MVNSAQGPPKGTPALAISGPLTICALFFVLHAGVGYERSLLFLFMGIFIMIILSFFWVAKSGGVPILSKRQLVIASLITAFMLLPAVVGMYVFDNVSGLAYLLMNLVAFMFFSQLVISFGDNSKNAIIKIFLLFSIISSLVAILIMFYPVQFAGLRFGKEGYFRLLGTFATPNRFGEVPAIGALSAIYLFLTVPSYKVWWLLIFIFLSFIMLLAGSKGVIVGFGFAILFYLFFTNIIRKKSFWMIGTIFVPIVYYVGYFLYDYILVTTKLDRILAGRRDFDSGRLVIWESGKEIFSNSDTFHILFGHGTTAFAKFTGSDAHSLYWNLLIEYGAISFIFIAGVCFYACRKLWRQKANRSILVFGTSLVAFALARGLTMPTIFNSFNMAMIAFWAGLALIVFTEDKAHK